MRKTLITAISLTLLALGLVAPPAAVAADGNYTVVGHPLTAPGLSQKTYTCIDGTPQVTPTLLERQGGTAGASALGWQVTPAGWTIGPRAVLAGDPYTLNRFEIDVLAPTGTTGWAHVYFEDDGDGTQFSQNDGWVNLTLPASGSWQHLDLSQLTYTWDWWVDDVYQGQYSDTIQGFAGDSGSISQATFDVVLGCGGEQFFLDRLMIGHSVNSVSYDFEAKPVVVVCHPGHVTPECPGPVDHKHHMAHLEWLRTGTVPQVGNAVTIRYGESVWMLGHAHVHSDVSGDSWYSGVGTLTSQLQAGSSVTTESGAFGPSQYAAVKESPERTTIYRFTAAAQDGFPAVTSKEVTVYVQAKVRARVLDRHLVEGQKLAVKGQIKPGTRRVKVTLQRKVGGRWTSLTASRTGAGGKFSLTSPAKTPGRWKVRVKVNTTSSNVGTVTRSATVKVDRYVPPKPRPQQPPPAPPVDSTPEVAAPVDTPEPTKITATAPTPPDRPTPTGRISAGGGSTRPAAGAAAPRASRG